MHVYNIPNCAHQAVDEELVLFCWSLLACIPHLAVAALHKPLLEVNWMRNVWVGGEGVCRKRERFKRGVEVGDTVLREEANKVQTTEGVFAW